MTPALTDSTGAAVTIVVTTTERVSSYVVNLDDHAAVGRADFVDSPDVADERIFFHTEVDDAFGGRGLAGLLVREALADSIRQGLTVVPLCPLFARHLDKHGEEYVAEGGAFRRATRADGALVENALRSP